MSGAIAKVQTVDRNINQLQSNISQATQAVLNNPLANGGALLTSVPLKVGANVVSHKLGRKLQGWFIVRMRGAFSQIFDTQDSNGDGVRTLLLNSSVAVTVDLFVF